MTISLIVVGFPQQGLPVSPQRYQGVIAADGVLPAVRQRSRRGSRIAAEVGRHAFWLIK